MVLVAPVVGLDSLRTTCSGRATLVPAGSEAKKSSALAIPVPKVNTTGMMIDGPLVPPDEGVTVIGATRSNTALNVARQVSQSAAASVTVRVTVPSGCAYAKTTVSAPRTSTLIEDAGRGHALPNRKTSCENARETICGLGAIVKV